MGLIILSTIVLLLGIIICIISCKYAYEGWFFSSVIIITVSAVTLIVMLSSLTIVHSNFKCYKNEYQNTKMLVDSYKGNEYGNINDLTKKVIYINDVIASHKAYSKNFWVNVWYSEEVGNFKPITFK